MSRSLDALSREFRPLAVELLARLVERRVIVMIVETSRTLEDQQRYLAAGTSRTARSKHLPRYLRGFTEAAADWNRVDAMDLCPYELFQLVGPDKAHWSDVDSPQARDAFGAIGEIAEGLGLRWGGRWKDPHDPGHVELVFPADLALVRNEQGRTA